MPQLLRNLVALVMGVLIGGSVNMALVTLGPSIIPPPVGADMTTTQGLAEAMPLLGPQHFVFPFLAHALGTFAGALVAWWIAASHKARFAYAVGVVFLAGGIAASTMIPAPGWFIALDLLLAYLPMAWVAAWMSGGRRGSPATAA